MTQTYSRGAKKEKERLDIVGAKNQNLKAQEKCKVQEVTIRLTILPRRQHDRRDARGLISPCSTWP